jgi:hypothetical protein
MLPGRESMIAIYDALGRSRQTDFCYLFHLLTMQYFVGILEQLIQWA